VSQRITDRLRTYADRERVDFSDLRRATWGRLFGIAIVAADRAPVDGFLSVDESRGPVQRSRRARAGLPTVAAAVRGARRDGKTTLAKAWACAGLRQEALVGDGEAQRLLEDAGGEIAERLSEGVLTVHADGRQTFVSDAVPLRTFVDLPAGQLDLRRRNSLRSRVLKHSIVGTAWTVRLGLLAERLHEVLAPFYESPGRRTVEEKQRGMVKHARYPRAMLQDIAGLLGAWRDGEYDGLTAAQVRDALRARARRRYEPTQRL
jgi:hypothetical protein